MSYASCLRVGTFQFGLALRAWRLELGVWSLRLAELQFAVCSWDELQMQAHTVSNAAQLALAYRPFFSRAESSSVALQFALQFPLQFAGHFALGKTQTLIATRRRAATIWASRTEQHFALVSSSLSALLLRFSFALELQLNLTNAKLSCNFQFHSSVQLF